MIRQDGNEQRMVCRCGFAGPAFAKRDFQQMLDAAKNDGWRITKRAGIYVHDCPGCVRVAAPAVQGRML